MGLSLNKKLLFPVIGFALAFACESPKTRLVEKEIKVVRDKLFTTIPTEHSNVDFINKIVESEDFNYYNYIYSYIGGGVASSDFNNDGLVDLFFTSGVAENKLYLNKGDLVFKDITKSSGIVKQRGFDMGVSVADVNNDGFSDIYICRGGWFQEDAMFANLLYVNNGDLTFTERAEEYGLADINRSIASVFFDYDNDGDLDLFISNNPNITQRNTRNIVDLDEVQKDPKTNLLKGSDKLYQNDGQGLFNDVSIKAGIMPDLGFGLNPQVGDLNNDGWLDVYVNNDFKIPDFAYINNGDGTFSESRNKMFKHMSLNSMGSDIADVNNDGLNDMLVLDMNPDDHVRSKTTMSMIPINKFWEMVNKNYHYQYMHNVLQLNNGNGTFSEIGNMAGVANTDWSWSVLFADFDLDGYKDIFISNGIYRDVLDRDANNQIMRMARSVGKKPTKKEFLKYTQMLPQQKTKNYFFKNNGDLTFSDNSSEWASLQSTFSNGAVYADLDNDGDLDVIVNNINEAATILRNNAIESKKGNFLQLRFVGPAKNKNGIGAIAHLYFSDSKKQVGQLINSRGYLSSVSNKLHFGLGSHMKIPKLEIIWPDGKKNEFLDVNANLLLEVDYTDASERIGLEAKTPKLFERTPWKYRHIERKFNDYDVQLLLPHKLSQLGPAIAKSDLNDDGLEDLYVGGGHLQEGQLLMGSLDSGLSKRSIPAFALDRKYEDIGATFFDADNDGDNDLYVVSGSYEFISNPNLLQDRLYLNDGDGHFTKCSQCLPVIVNSGSVVKAADYDLDGDKDLFIGGRVIPGKYPYAPLSHLLINEQGKFVIQTAELAVGLEEIGMVTDANWSDLDSDGDLDLVVTGEWMGIEVFENKSGRLIRSDTYKTLSKTTGWWNTMVIEDIDNDGDKDIIAGNLGLNYKFHASRENPFHVYASDFDNNGIEDIILAKNYNDQQVPIRGKSCTAQQMPYLKTRIKTYGEFANSDLTSILGEGVKSALHLKVNEFRSGIFIHQEDGTYLFQPFEMVVQKSLVNSIVFDDLDGDGIKDLLLAGNNYHAEIETTRADAGTGSFLKGDREGRFNYVPNMNSGFVADKDVRNVVVLDNRRGKIVFVANNNDLHDIYFVKTSKF